jgi:GNAT superfamily N-acetyltransferase
LVSNLPDTAKKFTSYGAIPALLIARMAVDTRHQEKGLGEFLLKYAFKCAFEISAISGCYAVLVDAKDEHIKHFYEKYGFALLRDHPLHLYIPLATLAEFFPGEQLRPGI